MGNLSFEAVVFDLDGVITGTASVHSAAWKQMFDEFLQAHAGKSGTPFQEFTHADDYLPYVDGKPRYKGVASFLESRGIHLPYGDPSDAPTSETVCGLGNRKNELFNELIAGGDFEVFASTVELVHQLRAQGVRVGVASSSKNATAVLAAAQLSDLFETVVDGMVSAELGLKGKPEPDIFHTACENLGSPRDRAVVVEDAVSGVQAGSRGSFGLVVGVAREDNEHELRLNGADIVVADLAEIDVDRMETWFSQELEEDSWSLAYHDYVPASERHREALLTVGNGYLGTRGAQEESCAGDSHYPGTYIAGVYNRLASEVAGRTVYNEDMVNCPNWLPVTFRVDGGEWLALDSAVVLEHSRKIRFRDGILDRRMVVRDAAGRQTLIESSRLASMNDPHIVALRYCLTPLNYSGSLTIRSGINGRVTNSGVERYRQLSSKHLQPFSEGAAGQRCHVVVQTNESGIQIAVAAQHGIRMGGAPAEAVVSHQVLPAESYTLIALEAQQGQQVCYDKVTAVYTSRDPGVDDPLQSAEDALAATSGYDAVREASAGAWASLWEKFDIQVVGDRYAQKLLRLNLYHCLVSASPHNVDIDAGIPARGLHGEAYRGHIFWDELFILPLYVHNLPEVAKSVLMYRFRRLDAARTYARKHGYDGAMFPWQSGSTGAEETQVLHLNPLSGEWGPDHSPLQRHVSLAIAYSIWHYVWSTGDTAFLAENGAELFLEICRFWASKARCDRRTGRYHIGKVMGPDEYHEMYPGAEEGGLKDNAYTNVMVAWTFRRSRDLLALLSTSSRDAVMQRIGLAETDLEAWQRVAERINIPLSESCVLEQFSGYFGLKELDWEAYRTRYGDIARMDRILKAERESPDHYKVAKQADALMTFYVLSMTEISQVLNGAGYQVPEDLLAVNLAYYLPRTSHGSTLSRLVHSYLASLAGDPALSWRLYRQALESDLIDIQGGTTREGIHTGVMAGTALLAMRSYAGLDLSGETVRIQPRLPAGWRELRFGLSFRGSRYWFAVSATGVRVKVECDGCRGSVDFFVGGRRCSLLSGQSASFSLAQEGS